MRAKAFQRLMHRLALVATLALVLVPALGRMAQACEDTAATDAFGAMCTAAGLVVEAPAPSHAHPPSHHASHHDAPPLPQVPMPHHGDGDCDYCPLLLSMVAPKPPALVAPATALQPAPMPVVASAPPPYAHPTGLLSRGPPAIS